MSVAKTMSPREIGEIANDPVLVDLRFCSCKMIEGFRSFLAFSPGSVHSFAPGMTLAWSLLPSVNNLAC